MGCRVVLAKPGLDGHDRGIKVIGMALRDAGAEVVYLGLRQTPRQIARAAAGEDADVVGISVLSGAHLRIAERVLAALDDEGVGDIPLVVGGTVPPSDAGPLASLGVSGVFGVGTPVEEAVRGVLAIAGARIREGEHA